MDSIYKKNLRRTLLELFYKISDGDQLHFISRLDLAERLGYKSQADSRFMSALKYLKDLGFIQVRDSINDTITTYGVQEAEAGYSTLQGINILNDDTAYAQFHLENVLTELMKQVDRDAKGILQAQELFDFESEIIKKIQAALSKLDKDEQLLFEKIKPTWRNVPKSGFVAQGNGKKQLQKYIDFIENKLQDLTGEPHKTEAFIPAGKPFMGRKQLRYIFNTAQKEILVVDNYLSSDILDILSSHLENYPNLNLRFLIDSDKKNQARKVKSFITDLGALKIEYPSLNIECREQTKMLHGRFIIVDSTDVYHSGNSFDNLGNVGDRISKVEDEESISNHLGELQKLWDSATSISQI